MPRDFTLKQGENLRNNCCFIMKGIITIPEELHQSSVKEGVELIDHQMDQLTIYYRASIEWNEKMNLTVITDEKDVYPEHLYDSLILVFEVDFTQPLSLRDVGSEAGFPSIPLKIALPELQITIVDSLNKQITLLSELTRLLGIDASLYHDRAETLGQNLQFRALSDFVTARAVARLNMLVELCLPLTKQEGYFYVLKAAESKEELTEVKQAIVLLGGRFLKEEAVTLPSVSDQQHIIVIQRKEIIPKKYPGKPDPPNKQPIKQEEKGWYK